MLWQVQIAFLALLGLLMHISVQGGHCVHDDLALVRCAVRGNGPSVCKTSVELANRARDQVVVRSFLFAWGFQYLVLLGIAWWLACGVGQWSVLALWPRFYASRRCS